MAFQLQTPRKQRGNTPLLSYNALINKRFNICKYQKQIFRHIQIGNSLKAFAYTRKRNVRKGHDGTKKGRPTLPDGPFAVGIETGIDRSIPDSDGHVVYILMFDHIDLHHLREELGGIIRRLYAC